MPRALIVNGDDSVATLLSAAQAGETIALQGAMNGHIDAIEEIPSGHKVALKDIGKGAAIVKYGKTIGRATDGIAAGSHVHVHNVESLRGRGDLAPAAGVGR